jgi:hypothetical protein
MIYKIWAIISNVWLENDLIKSYGGFANPPSWHFIDAFSPFGFTCDGMQTSMCGGLANPPYGKCDTIFYTKCHQQKRNPMKQLLLSLLILSPLTAATIPSKGSDLKITIYNENLAFVNEHRDVTVEKGKQQLIYEGVPSAVIPQSVIPTFSGVDTTLYSQNYSYDLISLDSMLQKSIDQNVAFYTNGEDPRLSEGTLLAVNPVMIQERQSGDIYTLNTSTQVIFSQIPDTMITKPSLVWNVETAQAGKTNIDLKYLTKGLSWESDYVLNLHNGTLDLTGWITVNNNSGVAYENAEITCLAGEVNRIVDEKVEYTMPIAAKMKASRSPNVQQESFSGYHIYKIPFKETIANKQQKQINFIEKEGVSYQQYGKYENSYFENYGEQKLSFTNTIQFTNSKKNNMGIPLPNGTVRMYQKDSSDQTHFIGEQHLKNIPEDENITLSIGTLFDVIGEKKITKFTAKNHYRNVETTYQLRNQGEEPVTLKLKENIPVYGERIKLKTSCKGMCSVKKLNAFVREFTIHLKAKESYSFTSEFEVNY